MTFALYFVLGILFKAFIDGIKKTSALIKLKKENEQKYKQVLRRIRKGKSSFKTRVNNTVYVATTLHETGDVDVILFLDTKKVAIFQNNACLHTSDAINEDLRKEIVTEIETRYETEISDVVEVLGNKISRGEIEGKINEMFSSKLDEILQNIDSDTEVNNEDEVYYTQEEINQILDKIAKDGIKSITPDEKRILDAYSNNLKN